MGVGESRGSPHRHPPGGTRPGELVAEAALAHAGLAYDTHHLGVTVERHCEGVLQDGDFTLPPNQGGDPESPGSLERRRRGSRPRQCVDPQRLAGTLDRHGTQILEAEPPLHQPSGVLGQVGPPRLRPCLHPLSQPHRVPESGGVKGHVVAHPSDDHLARVEPQADVQLEPLFLAQAFGVLGNRFDQVPGRMAGATGVILLCQGGTEERHDPVASELVDRPTEAAHPLGQDLDEAGHDLGPRLRVKGLLQLHRALHIGEQDGVGRPDFGGDSGGWVATSR